MTSNRSSSLSRLVEGKAQQREKLQDALTELTENNRKQEDSVVQQLAIYEDKLAVLREKKMALKAHFRRETDSTTHAKGKIKGKIKTLQAALNGLERNITETESLAFLKYNDDLEAFRRSIHPLDESLKVLRAEKCLVSQKITGFSASLRALNEQSAVLSKENEELKVQLKEYRSKQKEIAGKIAEKALEFPLESREILSEIRTKEELRRISDNKFRTKHDLRKLDSQLSSIQRELETALSARPERRKHPLRRPPNHCELLGIEKYLFCKLGTSFTALAISSVSSLDPQHCIMKQQYQLMERTELELIERSNTEQEGLKLRLSETTRERDQLQRELVISLSHQDSSTGLEAAISGQEEKIRQHRRRLAQSLRHNTSKISVIRK